MKLNPYKTHATLIGASTRVNKAVEPSNIFIDNIQVSENESRSDILLGIQIRYDLKWHMAFLTFMKNRLEGLSKLRYILPFKPLKAVSEGIFGSVLQYCLPLIGECSKTEINNLQILQNKAAQLVTR